MWQAVKRVNWQYPAAMMSDQLVISHAVFPDHYKPKLAVMAITPEEFIDNTNTSPASTEAFTFFAKNTNLGSDSDLFFANKKYLN